MPTIEQQASAYETSRERIDVLARDLGDQALAATVPCCPAWSVKDLVGHLTGLLEDRRDGRMPTAGFDEWTDQQVTRHRDEPIDAVLGTWLAISVEQSEAPPSLAALSFDVVTHEHDLCHAIGVRGDRDTASVKVGADRACQRMAGLLGEADAPGVVLTTEDGEFLAGEPDGAIGLSTTRFAVMRLVTGRMSRRQAEQMSWDGDPAAVLDTLFADGFFTLQPSDVVGAEAT